MFSLSTRPANALTAPRELLRDPFSAIDTMFSDLMNWRSVGTGLVARARLDVAEHDTDFEVRAELPGVSKDDISVDIDGAWISISANLQESKERREGERLLYSERSQESYARSFELPQMVDAAEASARFENGVLTLTLPKKSGAKTTRLNIR